MPRRFHTLLIANRGEIACRVARTARLMGLRTVAVYADGDEASAHVAACDEAVRLGPAPARDSYLRGELIIAAAKQAGAQAIHPGYGFLSENADFAQAVADAGLVFVGPPPAAMRAMGDKARAKALMAAAGVPLVPGYHGEAQDLATLQREADAMGYPVLIKASAGGGGKGMRVVNTAFEFASALASCQREAQASFGDARVLLERYLDQPRHIEVQVFADIFGHVLHLGERDCSVQRRHQKVLEEAPAPGLDAATRQAMGDAAVAAARSVGYVGAGTVEFICDSQGRFHFMEMNTRLQVEHPVTEAITGLDLVAWQLRVAMGEPLPLTQNQVACCGHAIEARLCAEAPLREFLPATGRLRVCRLPAASAFTPGPVRLDMGVREGDAIGPHYDSLLGKLIAWGPDRDSALLALQRALSEVHIVGLAHNVGFLRQVVATASFQAARLDTHLLVREAEAWQHGEQVPEDWGMAAAALAACDAGGDPEGQDDSHGQATRPMYSAPGAKGAQIGDTRAWPSPWQAQDAWRAHGPSVRHTRWQPAPHGTQPSAPRLLRITRQGPTWTVQAIQPQATAPLNFNLLPPAVHAPSPQAQCTWRLQLSAADGEPTPPITLQAYTHDAPDGRHLDVFSPAGHTQAWLPSAHHIATHSHTPGHTSHAGTLLAPMPGRVISVLAQVGDVLQAGQPLLVLEAMKMEHTLCAPHAAQLTHCLCATGDQVSEGATLMRWSPPPQAQSAPTAPPGTGSALSPDRAA
jgi:3-methylcrotonyl-CoA carboxylase alpha subunit